MRSPIKPPRSVQIWAVLAALALALFVGLSLLALLNRAPGAGAPTVTPAVSPRPTPTADMASSGAAETTVEPQPGPTELPAPELDAPEPADPAAALGLWLSAVSAITALIGLASSLWLGWRKEGREVAQHALELERVRLEIDKLRQELAAQEERRSRL